MGIERAFDRVALKVLEWAMRKKGIPDVSDRLVMSLFEGAMTMVKADSALSQEFHVKVEMHQ